jgi:trimeric autotransporter adhesin
MIQHIGMHSFEAKIRRRCTAASALLLTALLAGCGNFFVSGDTIVSIALSPTNPTVQIGETEQFVATGTTADGATRDVTPGATWTSSKPAVATINSSGLATAITAGTTVITAKYQEGSAQTFLTVTSATLSSITISPTNTSIAVGATQQYTATGHYSDGSTRNITSTVTWSSNYPNVATISTSGLATGIAGGSTVITATSGSISASTNLTVSN